MPNASLSLILIVAVAGGIILLERRYPYVPRQMHRWHHSDVVKDGSHNFATKLALWDWMFGTAHLPDNKKPKGYGILEIEFPKSYLRQHLFAFRPLEPDEYRTPG